MAKARSVNSQQQQIYICAPPRDFSQRSMGSWEGCAIKGALVPERMSRSNMVLRWPCTLTAHHLMMADTCISNLFNRRWTVFGMWCKWLGRVVHLAVVYGTLIQWYYNGAHGRCHYGSCGDNAPLYIWPGRFLFVFGGRMLSVPMGGAPVALCSWHAMET